MHTHLRVLTLPTQVFSPEQDRTRAWPVASSGVLSRTCSLGAELAESVQPRHPMPSRAQASLRTVYGAAHRDLRGALWPPRPQFGRAPGRLPARRLSSCAAKKPGITGDKAWPVHHFRSSAPRSESLRTQNRGQLSQTVFCEFKAPESRHACRYSRRLTSIIKFSFSFCVLNV